MDWKKNKCYRLGLEKSFSEIIGVDKLAHARILVTGATGLIGSYIVDLLLYANETRNMEVEVYALGRSEERLEKRFMHRKDLHLVKHDVFEEIDFKFEIDYVIFAAGNAYPAAFMNDPVGTILSNVSGTERYLQYAKQNKCKRFLYVSSGEVYGDVVEQVEAYDEEVCGYINPLQIRSCYPMAKRMAETLCVSFSEQYDLDIVIARPCHTYGPNTVEGDNRANVQFVSNAIKGNDIVLNSDGSQIRSYCYIADSAAAILTVLLQANRGEAYNISNSDSIVSIAEFAQCVASECGQKVVFNKPNDKEKRMQSPIRKQILSSTKIEKLGWKGRYSVRDGIHEIIDILKSEKTETQ